MSNINRYIALQKIMEAGSFTKAAEHLGYTQSSISQMMASLENELGIKLLKRSRTGVSLTIEGKELYPFIERTILQYRAMLEKANEIKGLETGICRSLAIAYKDKDSLPIASKYFIAYLRGHIDQLP